ncbi:DinB family protein [Amycolatopsis nalaikhensis]|uniref:DinB family protein n=1 Tax=Amycolatopsis nalaikhensis TaxID=715472 RepID=A0ABY8XWR6_9PSEU|nr:DinB family protein [Amycolatopsis sp. 2-2]WIV60128.1 DinB family protein [Amycolatopsis sp. 2-2]
MLVFVIDEFAKAYLHSDLREIREALLGKLDGLSEYDVRRPLTATGTNLLGLVKHLSVTEARYFGEVFGRPSPEPGPRWDDLSLRGTDMWATEHETREEIIGRYRRAWAHSDATIDALAVDAPGHVPWWPRPDVMLFNILVHVLTETSRHAGHADILREQLDGSVEMTASARQAAIDRRAEIERVARKAETPGPASADPGVSQR